MTPGRYSFWFHQDRGHARVGEIVSYTATSVTRELLAVDFGHLDSAQHGRFSGWFYLSPAELGFPFDDVEVETDLGPAPGWLIPAAAKSTRWVIQVHGRAVRRPEGLRAVPVFREAGYNSLLISYRNDGDAPESADNRYALGDTEWNDVAAAIRFAHARGAEHVVLMGWSMGGATVLQLLVRSPLSALVRGVVLESPAVDWVSVLHFQGASRRMPKFLRLVMLAMVTGRWAGFITGQAQPIDLARLDIVGRAKELSTPILLLHSSEDGSIPVTASRALAAARPDLVTYEEFGTARHTKLWNYDSARWNASIARWLKRLN
jgi:dipeptidyl aminopeptidase/acylaminoacyl peptidase